MSEKSQPQTGVLFKNDKKESDKHPDYKGRVTESDGTERWLAAWINEAQSSGQKYMKLSIGEPCEQGNSQQANQGGGSFDGPSDEFNDSIPFVTRHAIW